MEGRKRAAAQLELLHPSLQVRYLTPALRIGLWLLQTLESSGDGSTDWVPASHLGDLVGVLGSDFYV